MNMKKIRRSKIMLFEANLFLQSSFLLFFFLTDSLFYPPYSTLSNIVYSCILLQETVEVLCPLFSFTPTSSILLASAVSFLHRGSGNKRIERKNVEGSTKRKNG